MENYREEIVLWLIVCQGKQNFLTKYPTILTSLIENLNMYIPILSKEDVKDQESIQSSTTPDPVHSMGKWHIQESQAESLVSRDIIYDLKLSDDILKDNCIKIFIWWSILSDMGSEI